MRSSGSMLIICLTVLILTPAIALANGIYVPTVGSRASAMGGAFIGLADDYSAVYWNPAGITQIRGMEVTVTGHDVVSLGSRDGYMRFEGLEGADDGFRSAFLDVGATSDGVNRVAPGLFFYTDAGPLSDVFDKVGITAYTLTEYGTKWDGSDVLDDFVWMRDNINYEWSVLGADKQDYESRIKTYVISPVVAKEILPGLSVGVTANIAYSHFTLQNVEMLEYPLYFEEAEIWILAVTPLQVTDDATAVGYGATVGFLYRANRQLSVGLTVRSPMTMAYEGTFDLTLSGAGVVFEEKHELDFEMRFPMWVGAGFAYRDLLFDGLTLTGDVHWTDWSTFESINRNIVWAASDEMPVEAQLGFETTDLDWEDTVEVAVGFEYRLGRSLLLDLGYRNTPNPAPDATYDFVLPQTTKNVIGVGVTYLQDFWRASFALEYQAGEERTIQRTDDIFGKQEVDGMIGKHVEDIVIPSLSFTYAF